MEVKQGKRSVCAENCLTPRSGGVFLCNEVSPSFTHIFLQP
jgi:hypothetical protein